MAIRADGDAIDARLLTPEQYLSGLEIENDGLSVRPVGDREGSAVRSQVEVRRGAECGGVEGLWGVDPEVERYRPPEGDRPAVEARIPAREEASAIWLEEG